MATSISFTDESGPVTLTNGVSSPGDRFTGWQPLAMPIGPIHHALGTGVPYRWTHRTDYGARFSLAFIPNASQSDCVRLMVHLLKGESITVTTGDSAGNEYTAYLWPGSTPELSPPDKKDLRRTLTLSVLNSVESPMVCTYA